MHLRKLVTLFGILSLFFSHSLSALGLGDISLNSSLNQPLDAHISLRDLDDLSADQVVVKLGTQEDFEKVGLERSFFYTQLRFKVVADGPKGPFIAVTSRDPVREPYLSFVVEMRWTSGRVMREYTLLLDLPTFSDEAAAPVQGSVTAIGSNARPANNASAQTRNQSASVSAGASGGDVYGPVKSSDTLWEIARDHRPGNASIYQTMLAIQQANPDAFIRNNINLMRKGQVLRIPSESEINGFNNRQAINSVAEQNREWSGKTMGAQLDGSGRSSANGRAPQEVSGRVRLASGNSDSDKTTRNAGAGSAGSEKLARELIDTKDELARTRGENTELHSRVSDLEEQIETMERLLAVSNEQMRALEVAAQQNESTADPADTDTDTDAADNTDINSEQPIVDAETQQTEASEIADAADSTQADDTEASQAEPEQTEKAKAEAEKPVRNTTKVVRRAPEPSLMDKAMDNLLWIVLALALILILVVLVVRKRGSNSDNDDDFTPEYEETASFDEPEASVDLEQADDELTLDDSEDLQFEEAAEVTAAESAEPETGDVVGEADIYIALGKYDQAEEMLKAGLEREPGSTAIHLKLLEVYGESNNLAAFDERLTTIVAQGDHEAIARGHSLRQQHFPGAAEFVAPLLSAEQETDLSKDNFAQTFDLNDSAPAIDSGEADLSDDFDFDLSDSLDETPIDYSKDARLDDLDSAPEGSDEQQLDGSPSSYDLSFEPESDHDDTMFELDLEDETPEQSDATEQDDLTFDLDDDSEVQSRVAFDDLELSLDDAAEQNKNTASADDLSDLEFDLDTMDDQPEVAKDAPLLDEELTFDSPLESDQDSSLNESDVPTLDLADDDDDFDPDKAMDDFDLASMDKETADLDESGAGDDALLEPLESSDFDDDEAFEQALGADQEEPSDPVASDDLSELDESSGDDEEEFDFLADSDEVTTKLDLARAYIDMGDLDGARDILSEVAEEGNEEQKADALSLLEKAQS